MTPQRGSPWRTAIPLATGFTACAVSVIVLFPGWLSYDSAFQFWQVRTGEFSNLSPVVMTALWKAVHAVCPSPAAMLALHLAAFWTGIVLLAFALCRHGLARTAFILGVGFLPPAFLIFGHLWTDASLIAAMTLAFGLTVAALVGRRTLPLVLAIPVMLYAGAVRHNSLMALAPLGVLWAHAWTQRTVAARSPRTAGEGGFAVVGITALLVLASFGTARALDGLLARERVSTWAIGALWDLSGISVDAGTMVIPEFALTPGTDLTSLRAKYTPYTCVPLFEGPGRVRHGLGDELFGSDELAALRRAWLAAIVAHPRAYAKHRFGLTLRLFGPYRRHAESLFFVPTVVPYRDNPPPAAPLSDLRAAVVEEARRTRGWLIFTPALYLGVAVGALACGWRRRRSLAGKVALSAAGSGLFLVLPLVAFAPSAELRYSGWLFTSSVVAAVACGVRPGNVGG